MENVIVNGKKIGLETLRKNVVDFAKRAYGAERRYAVGLNETFADFDWFAVEAGDKSEQAKPVHAEKNALYAELKKIEHKNPSEVWKRLRKYGRVEKYGKEPKAETESESESESESKEKGASRNKPPMLRNIDDLVLLYKFNERQDNLPSKVVEAQKHIAHALCALGVNLSMLK
jgi:hypothetical protein